MSMERASNEKLQEPDRFDLLSLEYAEAYLGRRGVERILHGSETATEPSWLGRLLRRLRG